MRCEDLCSYEEAGEGHGEAGEGTREGFQVWIVGGLGGISRFG